MPSDDELAAIKRRAADAFLALPGVYFVGIGSKEVDGSPTGEAAIKVYVHRKRPPAEVPHAELIPSTFEGIATDVIETGEIVSVVDPPGANEPAAGSWFDESRHRPLVGGTFLQRDGAGYAGTLGCFVWDPADHGKAFALTNHHVMRPPEPDGSTTAGQPSTDQSCSGCCGGTIGWFSVGARSLAPDGSKERDEALIRLMPGVEWKAEIADIGAVAGTHDVTDAEASPGTYKVRKRGSRTGLTGGTVSAAGAVNAGSIADNLLLVTPNAAPGPGTSFFVSEGDSGSVVVNEANEVVGLVHARSDTGLGIALTIGNVLQRLVALGGGVAREIAVAPAGTVHTVPGSAMVELPPEVAEIITGRPQGSAVPGRVRRPVAAGWPGTVPLPTPAAMHGVVADLDATPTGRRLVQLWLRHQGELLRLLDTNKRVAMVWHRSGAAALSQCLVRMVHEHDLDLPETVNGRPTSEVVDRLHAVFARFASAALREDLDRVRPLFPDLGGRTYPQLVAALGAE